MKIECPICGTVGFLQKRGNGCRVQHYMGFKNGRRLYSYHAIDSGAVGLMEVEVKNGSKSGSKSTRIKPRSGSGASGGLRSRDHYLTKVTPHRARLPRHSGFSLKTTCDMK
jgi:hypothetical protein